MPSAPRGKGGRGKGFGGGPSRADKSAPIAIPSRDYKWTVNHRDFAEGSMEAREEARQREAEERRWARENGEQVDLGQAGRYWERIVENPSDRRPIAPSSDKIPAASANSAPVWSNWSKSNVLSKPESNGWDKWSETKSRETKRDDYSQNGSSSHARHDNWDNKGDVYSQKSSSSHARRDNGENHGGKENQGWNDWNPPGVDAGNQRSHEDEGNWNTGKKASDDGANWQNQSSEWSIGGAGEDINQNSRDEWGDHGDKDAGSSLKGAGSTADVLFLQDSPQLESDDILTLLRDPQTGIGNLRELHVGGCQLSPETCWRICEMCASRRPSPAFRLCLHGKTRDECFGAGMILWQVLKTGTRFGDLKIAGLDTEIAEADLHIFAIVADRSFQ